MKKSNQWIATGLLSFTLISNGCKKDNPTPESTAPAAAAAYETGVFISNEGPYGSGTGTVSFYNRSTGAVTNDIFQKANGVPLGNIVQSVNIYNGKGYVMVNNAGKIEVVNAPDFKSMATIAGLTQPRYFLGINSTKGYVTEWGTGGLSGSVKVIDLSLNKVLKTIATGKGAENMINLNGLVYVTCKGGYGKDSVITVINTNSDAILATIMVGVGPGGIVADANGKIWVLCSKKLVRINPTTQTVEAEFVFTSIKETPSNLTINAAKNTLYYCYDGKVYPHDISAATLSSTPLINKSFYGMSVDPTNDYLFCADAGNFSSDGYVFRYKSTGAKVDSFKVGMIPGGFFFK
jgi:DNA-binding beta-propeller fold protein YncE